MCIFVIEPFQQITYCIWTYVFVRCLLNPCDRLPIRTYICICILVIEPCGEVAELPIYGILIQSPSFPEDAPGPCGAANAECSERPESRRPARPGELLSYINLTLVLFL